MAIYRVQYKAYRGGVWDVVEGVKEYESWLTNEKVIVDKILRDVGKEIGVAAYKIKAVKVVKLDAQQGAQLSLLDETSKPTNQVA